MGPHMLFNLGAGEGGMSAFCERYADSFHRWWDDLGTRIWMLLLARCLKMACLTPQMARL